MSRYCSGLLVAALTVAVASALGPLSRLGAQSDSQSSAYAPLRSQDRMDKFNNANADSLEGGTGAFLPRRNAAFSRNGNKPFDRNSDYYSDPATSFEPSYRVRNPNRQGTAAVPNRRPGVAAAPATNSRNGWGFYNGYDDMMTSDQNYEAESKMGYYDGGYEPAPAPSSSSTSWLRTRPNLGRKSSSYGGRGGSPLALLVAPLAGIAFITAAAALAINPATLTISASLVGRKKRDLTTEVDPEVADQITPELMQKVQELQTLEKFLSSIPKETDYQQKIMSMYLSCSGYMEDSNLCLDRVFCEYGNAESTISSEERDVLSIVLYNIMDNKSVMVQYKNRLRAAARLGRDTQQCARYTCGAFNPLSNVVD